MSRVLFDLVYILVSIAVLLWWVSGRIAQEDRRYTFEFVGDVLAAAHSVPWWALIPFVPPVLRVSLNDWSADSPMMALARLCDQWSKVAYWFAVVVMVIASVSGAIALVSAASVKGVLVVIAALLVILVPEALGANGIQRVTGFPGLSQIDACFREDLVLLPHSEV